MIKVFISYSSQQEDCAKILVNTMEGMEEDEVEKEEEKIAWDEANNKYLQGKKYKVLFHERDFIAGREIIFNIHQDSQKHLMSLKVVHKVYFGAMWSGFI